MKRVSKEHVGFVVTGFLKRRNYTKTSQSDNGQLLSQRFATSVIKMAADTESSSVGTISCGCVSEPATYEEQFSRLVVFIKEAKDKHKQQLMQVLFPLFISIFIDLLVNGLKQAATKFHARNRTIFINLPAYKQAIETISNVLNKCDQDPSLSMGKVLRAELGENKYHVPFSEETLYYLTNYLQTKDNMLILQLFNNHITVDIQTDLPVESTVSMNSSLNKVIKNESALSSLKTAVGRMKSATPHLPSLRLHAVSAGGSSNVISGIVSSQHIAVGCSDSSIKVWTADSKCIQRKKTFSDVSQVYLAGDWIEDIDKRNEINGRNKPLPSVIMKGHSGDVYDLTHLDSTYLLSCSRDTSVRLWDLETYTNKAIYQGHTRAVWQLAKGNKTCYFATASRDRTARLWSTDRTHSLRVYAGHTLSVDCVAFHPNNVYLATGSQDKTVRLWSVQDGSCVRLMQGHRSNVLTLAFSPDGRYLASAGEDRRIKIWDLASALVVKELKGHTDIVHCLDFNADGSILCSGGQDAVVYVWDARIGCSSDTSASSDLLGNFTTQEHTIVHIQADTNNVVEVVGASR